MPGRHRSSPRRLAEAGAEFAVQESGMTGKAQNGPAQCARRQESLSKPTPESKSQPEESVYASKRRTAAREEGRMLPAAPEGAVRQMRLLSNQKISTSRGYCRPPDGWQAPIRDRRAPEDFGMTIRRQATQRQLRLPKW